MSKNDAMRAAVEALEWTIREIDRNTCTHEDTYRGGAIWTICRDCDMKWADDSGGFKPYKEPKELKAARSALSLLRSALEEGEEPEETPIYLSHEKRAELQRELNAFYRDRLESIYAFIKAKDKETP